MSTGTNHSFFLVDPNTNVPPYRITDLRPLTQAEKNTMLTDVMSKDISEYHMRVRQYIEDASRPDPREIATAMLPEIRPQVML